MLLYDHVREHAENTLRRCGEELFGFMNCQNLFSLRKAAVYEASDVVPLFGDWSRDKDKPIPKTPPHPVTWVEWKYPDYTEDGRFGDDWALGVHVTAMPPEMREQLISCPPVMRQQGGMSPSDFFAQDKDFYLVQMYKRLERFRLNPDQEPMEGQPKLSLKQREEYFRGFLNQPCCDLGTFVWSHNQDGSGVHRFKLFPNLDPNDSPREKATRASIFFLPVNASFALQQHWQCADPWPAFMAFSLLHCKNVVTETHEPSPKLQRRMARAGNPPRVTYRVLKIEVPASAQQRGEYEGDEEDAGPKVRFHLCSGHFKHLTSERYKSKRGQWIWCPAHWKGSKELGEVHKRYALTPNQQEGQP